MDAHVFDYEGPWTEDAFLGLPRDGRVEVVDGTLLMGPAPTPQRSRVIGRVRAAVEAALPDGLRVVGPVPLRLGPDCLLVPDLIVTFVPEDEASGTGAAGTEEPSTEAAGDARDATGDPDEATARSTASSTDADPAGGSDADPGESTDPGADADPAEDADPGILDAAAALMVIEVVGREHGATDRSFKPQLYARSRIPYSLLIDHDGPFAVVDMIISGRYHQYARAGDGEKLQIEEPFRLDIDLVATTCTEPGGPEPEQP